MSRKTTIDALFTKRKPEALGAPNPTEQAAPVVRSGAVAAMGASLQQWSAAQKTAEDLQAQLAAAVTVIEVEPSSIDPAPVRDRLDIESDASFEALMASIRTSGQQVPILVRPHPEVAGRYQAAYGHRRMAAAKRLGMKVRAIVATLSDEALVIAQGKENSERRDLSFVEKALFARRLEDAGFGRAMICHALATDKADLSRSLAVARTIPEQIILDIGAAPKAGRARWLAFSERLKEAGYLDAVHDPAKTEALRRLPSDQRFKAAFELLVQEKNSEILVPATERNRALIDAGGREIGKIKRVGSITRLSLNDAAVPGFAAYLEDHFLEFYEAFRKLREEKTH